MMILFSKLFENLFADSKITPTRFRNFCRFVLNAMNAVNTDGRYDAFIEKIKTVIDALNKELSGVDSGVTNQIFSTSDVDAFIAAFGQYMKKQQAPSLTLWVATIRQHFLNFIPIKTKII